MKQNQKGHMCLQIKSVERCKHRKSGRSFLFHSLNFVEGNGDVIPKGKKVRGGRGGSAKEVHEVSICKSEDG